jgi:hypothetical protein
MTGFVPGVEAVVPGAADQTPVDAIAADGSAGGGDPAGGAPGGEPAPASTMRLRSLDGGNGQVRILVVDDEAVLREMTAEMLKSRGYEVLLAADGIEALDIYRREWGTIALVVLDMIMPRLGGLETFRRLTGMDRKARSSSAQAHGGGRVGVFEGGDRPRCRPGWGCGWSAGRARPAPQAPARRRLLPHTLGPRRCQAPGAPGAAPESS